MNSYNEKNFLDWNWQLNNRITSISEFSKFFNVKLSNQFTLNEYAPNFLITPYYASLIKQFDYLDPIFKMIVPSEHENQIPEHFCVDPLKEKKYQPRPCIIQRYPDRVVLLATNYCAAHCRYCTRKWTVNNPILQDFESMLTDAYDYLSSNSKISEVIISGGDPLILSDEKIEAIITMLRKIPHINVLRIGTKIPATMPMRITDSLCKIIKKFPAVWISTHFNHPNELTELSRSACAKFIDHGIPINNQTVLLNGVNSSAEILEELFRELVKICVKPYYLFQCDLVPGTEHFRTPLQLGIDLMKYLYKNVSGIMIPQFVVDTPDFGGKLRITPNCIQKNSKQKVKFITYNDEIINYPDKNF